MLTAAFLRGLAFSAVSSMKSDPSAVILVYALPIAGIVISIWFLATGRPVALPRAAQARIDMTLAQTQARFADVGQRYLALRRRIAGVRA